MMALHIHFVRLSDVALRCVPFAASFLETRVSHVSKIHYIRTNHILPPLSLIPNYTPHQIIHSTE